MGERYGNFSNKRWIEDVVYIFFYQLDTCWGVYLMESSNVKNFVSTQEKVMPSVTAISKKTWASEYNLFEKSHWQTTNVICSFGTICVFDHDLELEQIRAKKWNKTFEIRRIHWNESAKRHAMSRQWFWTKKLLFIFGTHRLTVIQFCLLSRLRYLERSSLSK